MTISLRLDAEMTRRLIALSRAEGITKSEFIRRCLQDYLLARPQEPSAWELGKDLFGCYQSGRGDLSQRVKEITRKRIREERDKQSRR